MSTLTPNQRRDRIATWTKLGAAAVAIFFLTPAIITMVEGLIALVAFVVIGLAFINFLPFMSMWFANMKLKAILAEIARNPILSLTNDLLEKEQKFNEAKEQYKIAVAALKTYAQKVEGYKKKWPAQAPAFEKQRDDFAVAVQLLEKNIRAAQAELRKLEETRQQMSDLYDMAMEAQKANNAIKMTQDDIFDNIRQQAAIDAVMSQANSVFADLQVTATLSIPDDETPLQVTHQPGVAAQVIDLADHKSVA